MFHEEEVLDVEKLVEEDWEIIEDKLSHITVWEEKDEIIQVLKDCNQAVAWTLEDVWPSTVEVTHEFDLSDENPTFQRHYRMSLLHEEVVRIEVECMLSSGIIKPVQSS